MPNSRDAISKALLAWNTFEILLLIARHLPFFDLLRLRYFAYPGGDVVAQVLRERVCTSFSPFLPQRVIEFFYHLEECRGVVMGSVVNDVFLDRDNRQDEDDGVSTDSNPNNTTSIRKGPLSPKEDFSPSPMAIVIEGNPEKMKMFLVSLGYQREKMEPVEYDDAMSFIWGHSEVLREKMEAFSLGIVDKTSTILILPSRRSALEVVLSADSTPHMNYMSFDSLMSFYPRLIFRKEGLFVSSKVDPIRRHISFTTVEGLKVLSDNRHWGNPCGVYCPATWRQTSDDEGAMRVAWFPGPRPKPMALSEGTGERIAGEECRSKETLGNTDCLTWRVSNRCMNPFCEYGRRYGEISLYVDM